MARISIDLPEQFLFYTTIPVRVTDLNYGGHVGNDSILSLIHEGRMQFLRHYELSEKDFAGTGLIMGDVGISFRNELFYGDVVRMSITVTEVSKFSFDIIYKLEKTEGEKTLLVAAAKTGMICFDYDKRKIAAVPESVKEKWK